jgi:hypothetical protein
MAAKRTSKKKKTKTKTETKKETPAQETPEKSKLLDLVVRSNGEKVTYNIDLKDLDYCEIATRELPGIRFIIIREHVNGK